MNEKIKHSELERLRDLLVGRSVKWVEHVDDRDDLAEGRLMLDDGTTVRIGGNDGCGGCPSGSYSLAALRRCPNLITNVDVEHDEDPGDDEFRRERYRLFVIAEDDRINVAEFVGTDGNGYYGTGFWLEVRP